MAKWWQYIINPLVGLDEAFDKFTDSGNEDIGNVNEPEQASSDSSGSGSSKIKDAWNKFKGWISGVWDDLTGKSQIELQNQLDRDMAEEEYQRNLQSIGDTAAAYEAAGLNRNLLYGGSNGSPVQYSAPNLQAYSGSRKIDSILSRVAAVTKFIPAMYQATAGLEAIDQAREKTKQSEIRTMAMGMDLLDKGYKVGEQNFKLPFVPEFQKYMRGYDDYNFFDFLKLSPYTNDVQSIRRYADSALKNTFDTLEAVGVANSLNKTRNSYMGYQYDLDRRFGAAGRVMNLVGSGVGTAVKAILPFKGLKATKQLNKLRSIPTVHNHTHYDTKYTNIYN